MNLKTICLYCKNWKLTEPVIKYGWCSVLKMKTEWQAGVVWKTKYRIKICPHFSN